MASSESDLNRLIGLSDDFFHCIEGHSEDAIAVTNSQNGSYKRELRLGAKHPDAGSIFASVCRGIYWNTKHLRRYTK